MAAITTHPRTRSPEPSKSRERSEIHESVIEQESVGVGEHAGARVDGHHIVNDADVRIGAGRS